MRRSDRILALWPLAVVLILAACASPQPATITVAPSADNVVLHQIGPFSGLAGGLIAIDGTRGPFPREVAIDPGRHTLLLENQCGPGVSNRAYARIDMAFAPGTSYRVTGQRHIWENSCRVGLVAEPTGRVICEVETATNEITHRLVSSLDHVTDHCQGWTYWAVASIGQRRPWAGPFPVVPHDIDDPVALAEMATVGIALLPLRGVDRRRLRSAAKYKQNMYPAVFVVPSLRASRASRMASSADMGSCCLKVTIARTACCRARAGMCVSRSARFPAIARIS